MGKIAADNAILDAREDALGRTGAAQLFVEQVLAVDASDGLVVAVLGTWGSGKTSFVNLTREGFASSSVPVVDFNPWMFSGADQLVDWFFSEIGAELKLRPGLGHIGELFSQYGDLFSGLGWIPVAGPWIERARVANKAFATLLQRRKKGSRDQRVKLRDALAQRSVPLVVIIDDIDRLTSKEIREIFKLVRLTANFPNVVYVLAFDRYRVEEALHEDDIPGRAYLEKIVQIEIDLPALPGEILQSSVLGAIQESVDASGVDGPFSKSAWPDTFSEIVLPLIATMRDVRRLALSIFGTMRSVGEHVDAGDLIALDAVRVFLPDVWAQIPSSLAGLTTTRSFGAYGGQEPPYLKAQVEGLMASAPAGREDIVRSLITRLFPAAGGRMGGTSYGSDFEPRWLVDRRVAHQDVLRLVLERTLNAGLRSHMSAEAALLAMSDVKSFAAYFDDLDDADQISDVLAALYNLSRSFTDANVVPGLVVSHNLLPRLAPRNQGMASIDGRFVVGRLTYLLLERLSDSPETVLGLVRESLPQIDSLWGRYELITSVGHRENAGHKFVDVAAAKELEKEWREQVRKAPAVKLATEQELFHLLLRVKNDAGGDEPSLYIPEAAEVTLAVLRSARHDVRSSAIGNRAVFHEQRLYWNHLAELYGSEDALEDRVESARPFSEPADRELYELVDRYLSGWRPRDL